MTQASTEIMFCVSSAEKTEEDTADAPVVKAEDVPVVIGEDGDEDGGSDVDAGEACDNKCGANEKCMDGVCTCPEGADCAGKVLLDSLKYKNNIFHVE